MKPSIQSFAAGLALCIAAALPAAAQNTEPSVDQIYQAAKAGQLDRAESMVDQVIKSHPTSAKAHYVKAEISAREGNMSMARQELNTAESLAPGLPFAKPDAVQSLKTEIARGENTTAATHARARDKPLDTRGMGSGPSRSGIGGVSWVTIAIAAVVVLLLARLMRRRRSDVPPAGYGPNTTGSMPPGGYGPQAGSGPQAYGQPGYGQPGYGQQPGGGMGSSIARGVGAGLGLGAGMVAAQEIGRRVFDHRDGNVSGIGNNDAYPPTDTNADMGGNDFGLNAGWDDGTGGSVAGGDDFGVGGGGGGDWDT